MTKLEFSVKNLEIELYDYFPTAYLFRYVDYQVFTQYVNENTYNIIVRRIDCNAGWIDNLKVMVHNNITHETSIYDIPNTTTEINEQVVVIHTNEPIYPYLDKPIEIFPVIHLPPICSMEKHISKIHFNEIFKDANIRTLPTSLFAVGLKNKELYIYNEDYSRYGNIREPIYHIIRVALYYGYDNFYFVISSADGYMEGVYHSSVRSNYKEVLLNENIHLYCPTDENEIPVFHDKVTILAQSCHVGLPHTINIVDRHYFYHNLYHSFESFHLGIPFHQKINKLVFGGQDRDLKYNFFTRRDIDIAPRQYFRDKIAPKYSEFVVCGGWITRETMAQNYKYILDIDGRASTFDATCWKMNSGSIIFKPKSVWCQWFYDKFIPHVHFIELKEDFSDIEEKYQWCERHPAECLEMIKKCKELFKEVYTFTNVIQYTKSVIEKIIEIPVIFPTINKDTTINKEKWIEHAFFINLETRRDRLQEIQEEFQRMEIQNIFISNTVPERFNAIPTKGFGILGCTKSHCEVMKIARERKYKNVLIFEDDLLFIVEKEVLHEELQQIYESKVDFDVIMFAYNIKESVPSVEYPFLSRIKNASTASCYLINGEYLETLINLYDEAIPLLEQTRMHWEFANDVIWKVLMQRDRWFATNTRIGIQRPSYSDNSQEFMNHGC